MFPILSAYRRTAGCGVRSWLQGRRPAGMAQRQCCNGAAAEWEGKRSCFPCLRRKRLFCRLRALACGLSGRSFRTAVFSWRREGHDEDHNTATAHTDLLYGDGACRQACCMPFTAILTDFVRIPGGSLATGFALAFLVIGVSLVPVRGAGTLMGFVQGAMALFLGMSGYQGAGTGHLHPARAGHRPVRGGYERTGCALFYADLCALQLQHARCSATRWSSTCTA